MRIAAVLNTAIFRADITVKLQLLRKSLILFHATNTLLHTTRTAKRPPDLPNGHRQQTTTQIAQKTFINIMYDIGLC